MPLIVYCTAALTLLSDKVSCITFFIFGVAYLDGNCPHKSQLESYAACDNKVNNKRLSFEI